MKRGRPSGTDLSVIVDISRAPPPQPPPELPASQQQTWRDIFGAVPSGYISRAAFPVAVELCRRIDRGRMLESLIEQFQPEWLAEDGGIERLDRLLAMAERESRGIVSCSRSLRLTPQSVQHPASAGRKLTAHRPAGVQRPWDVED
jgi:hypothetical protein